MTLHSKTILEPMFRANHEHSAYSMTEKQIEQLYQKMIKLRGTLIKHSTTGASYLGMRVSSHGEEWCVFREIIAITFIEEGKTIHFIDENRQIEEWLFEILKPRLFINEVNVIVADLTEVLSRSSESYY